MATTVGSLLIIPFPFMYMTVLAVPKSIATSLENHPKKESKSIIFTSIFYQNILFGIGYKKQI